MRRRYRSHWLPVAAGIILVFWPIFGASQDARLDQVPDTKELTPSFYRQFQTLSDLSSEKIIKYFSIHPEQVGAFRIFVKSLVDNGMVHELHSAEMLSAASVLGEFSSPDNILIPQNEPINDQRNDFQSALHDDTSQKINSRKPTATELAKREKTEYYMAVISELEDHSKPLNEIEGQIYQETRAIAVQLDLVLPLQLLRNQSRSLSQDFGKNFRSKEQFKSSEFRMYFVNQPNEIWALREYMQELTDLELIPHSMAVSAVTTAFKAASYSAIKSENTVSLIDPAPSEKKEPKEEKVLDVAELPVGVLPEVVGAYLEKGDKPDFLEFGATPEIRGAAVGNSAEQIIKELEERERRQKLAKTAAKIMRAFAQNNIPKSDIGKTVAQIFRNEAEKELSLHATEEIDESLDKLVDNAEVSVVLGAGEPTFKLQALKSFETSSNDSLYGFTQFSGLRTDDETTVNVGIGIRALDQSRTMLIGGNTFYDRQLDNGHERLGIGVEVVSTPLKFNANRYFALSEKKQISSTASQQALDGRDVKFKGALPYFPGLFADYTDFKWYGVDGGADLQGQKYGLSGQLSDSFNINIDRTSYDSGQSGQNSVMLTYNYIDQKGWSPRLYELSPIPWQLRSISDHERYQFVERENEIVKQTTTGSGGGLAITFSSI